MCITCSGLVAEELGAHSLVLEAGPCTLNRGVFKGWGDKK